MRMLELGLSRYFPPVELAGAEGLLCVGGQLTPDWIVDAYRHGIFPWPVLDDEMLLAWWSPDPRAVIEFDQFHLSRRLRRTLQSGRFTVTCDRDFAGVVDGCATVQDRLDGTWLTPQMIKAYHGLHQLGRAHSIEVWREGKLVGGVYGVALDGFFAGESMFYRERDASKVALAHLLAHLRARGYRLFDIQQLTDHTASLGASEIPRTVYLSRLAEALQARVTWGDGLEGDPCAA